MEALARNRQSPSAGFAVPLWGGGALLAVVLGIAAATSITAVAGLLAVLAALAVVVAAFTATRWALIVLLFVLYSYAGWVLSHAAGAPEPSQALVLLIAAALAWRHLTREEKLSIPGELTVFLALWLTFVASAAFATDPDSSLLKIRDLSGYGLLVVTLVALLDRPVWLRRAVWTVVVAGGALASISLLQAATGAYDSDFAGFALARPEGEGVFRVSGPLDPNVFGQVLVATSMLALYLALSARDRAGRALALAMFTACIAATGLTGSRGALVAAAAAFCLLLLFAPIPRGVVAATVALVVTAGLVFLPSGIQARVGVPVGPSEQVTAVEKGSEGAIRGRKSENIAALQMFRDHPFFGVGPGNYSRHYLEYSQGIGLDKRLENREPHNLYLGTLAETGIVGASAFFAVLWLALRGAWRGRRRLGGRDALLAEGIFVALASFLVAGLFLHSTYPRYTWILIGFGFVAGQLAQKQARARELASRPARGGPARTAAASTVPAEPVAVEGPAVAERQAVTWPARPGGRPRGRAPLLTAAAMIAVAVSVAIGLTVAGGDDKAPTQTSPPAEPAGGAVGSTVHCEPIIGSGPANSGKQYTLTSFDPGGSPIDCAKAQSILLTALNGGGDTAIGEWSCTTDPAGSTIATCTTIRGRKIQAGG
jgi:putative inorganic carbon (HCO3(-)) transporter